jgi:hypothetical protein
VIWGLVLGTVLAIVVVFVMSFRFSVGGEMPELRRPMAVLEGVMQLDDRSTSERVEAELRLDDGAFAAMRQGDGMVHLEIDVEPSPEGEPLLVGVSWTSRAEVLRPVTPLAVGEDVRWTVACADVSGCQRTVGFQIELPPGASPTAVAWRLVAEVRPPRESEVPDVAIVQLTPVDGEQ